MGHTLQGMHGDNLHVHLPTYLLFYSVCPPISGRAFNKFPAARTPLTFTFSVSLTVTRTAAHSWSPKAPTTSLATWHCDKVSVRLPSAQLACTLTANSGACTHSMVLWQQSRMNPTSSRRQGYWQRTPTARIALAWGTNTATIRNAEYSINWEVLAL